MSLVPQSTPTASSPARPPPGRSALSSPRQGFEMGRMKEFSVCTRTPDPEFSTILSLPSDHTMLWRKKNTEPKGEG